MKAALSRIFEFFAAHDPRQKRNPTFRSYCICGALKPPVEPEDGAPSLKSESRSQGL
jgi:hypothetical protein